MINNVAAKRIPSLISAALPSKEANSLVKFNKRICKDLNSPSKNKPEI